MHKKSPTYCRVLLYFRNIQYLFPIFLESDVQRTVPVKSTAEVFLVLVFVVFIRVRVDGMVSADTIAFYRDS